MRVTLIDEGMAFKWCLFCRSETARNVGWMDEFIKKFTLTASLVKFNSRSQVSGESLSRKKLYNSAEVPTLSVHLRFGTISQYCLGVSCNSLLYGYRFAYFVN